MFCIGLNNSHQLEAGQHGAADAAELVKSLPLFDHAQPRQKPELPAALDAELAAIRPDDLTPRDAIELLYRLKRPMMTALVKQLCSM
ncbi:MAG: hypothetical protein CM15mP46_0640 [Alphaproteobacteria bacterium]|nr:MAG: hypothetical protein CM15mP46_0640 [Alphaproteobacteria bacterium]